MASNRREKSGSEGTGASPFDTKRPKRRRFGIGFRLRSYFLTGLIIVGPISITVLIVWWFVGVIDTYVKPLVPDVYNPETYLPFPLPGVGLLFAIFALTIIGALAANLLGRSVISFGELILGRMPVVRNVYAGLKQIFETVLSESSQSFQKAGLIEYPRRGLYSVVFISTDAKGEIAAKWEGDHKLVSVFLPTTPNPTSGYLLFVPEDDIVSLDMSVEEAAKLVISAGLVTPDYVPTGNGVGTGPGPIAPGAPLSPSPVAPSPLAPHPVTPQMGEAAVRDAEHRGAKAASTAHDDVLHPKVDEEPLPQAHRAAE